MHKMYTLPFKIREFWKFAHHNFILDSMYQCLLAPLYGVISAEDDGLLLIWYPLTDITSAHKNGFRAFSILAPWSIISQAIQSPKTIFSEK